MKYIFACLRRRVFLTFGLLALLLLLGTHALPVSAESPSFIGIVNASPDVGTVDVFVDGKKFLGNAMFASVTDYSNCPQDSIMCRLHSLVYQVSASDSLMPSNFR